MGAQFHHVLFVAFGAEVGNGAVGAGNFAVGGHAEVEEEEGETAFRLWVHRSSDNRECTRIDANDGRCETDFMMEKKFVPPQEREDRWRSVSSKAALSQ